MRSYEALSRLLTCTGDGIAWKRWDCTNYYPLEVDAVQSKVDDGLPLTLPVIPY